MVFGCLYICSLALNVKIKLFTVGAIKKQKQKQKIKHNEKKMFLHRHPGMCARAHSRYYNIIINSVYQNVF